MNIEDFDFNLPEELIAQTPLKDRTASRMLVLQHQTKKVEHKQFTDIKNYLKKDDCLVLNDTRVLPARLYGTKQDTGANVEVLLLHQQEADTWEVLVKPAKKVNIGAVIVFGDGKLRATCVGLKDHGGRILQLEYDGFFNQILDELGEMPLPPYIKKQLPEKERYQTVYATEEGSAAAPTAGLHFTNELLDDIRSMGVSIEFITLHVGLGTFRPVSTDRIEEHKMHAEFYHMSKETADALSSVRANGGRIITVGTTSTRTLETIARDNGGKFAESSGWTDIFIYPPYDFQAIDGLITNFHLPKSTLIMMVSALAGRENIMHAYQEAIKERYRFFSFGDAMLIL
ncbi:S-adenosylmethionine:tRNA ribosyltransferase-isomerase [Lentibacillus kapialis]|uniref:S-adenosylmethionine:tRNA ribosyltransferase-isomerase n=1 Tax=Lentibacillus kapialis TaxID=340214 RepID=A0A917PM20_9BACI|nr:tRNA preQ1(34) S-adenosylmethionine ribosyltransferase-isomerase QueA [Lentibacillus kapialis]GGJ83999.1 S-adenosylmethionine:tRNA ribosyltransferase-isomerase [Lentibacillus kapialis]